MSHDIDVIYFVYQVATLMYFIVHTGPQSSMGIQVLQICGKS